MLLETFREEPHRARLTETVRDYLAHSAPRLRDDTGLEGI